MGNRPAKNQMFGAFGKEVTFRQLEILHSVVIAGSITRASQRIDLSQPSISQQLAKLEELLGAKLIERNRTGSVTLTPAGDYWFKQAESIISHMRDSLREHDQRFRDGSTVLRLGITPALRGSFVIAAAKIALRGKDLAKFEIVYDFNSLGLFEQLRLHKVNFAILASEVMGPEADNFAVGELFTDDIALAVPTSVSEDDLKYAFTTNADPGRIRPELLRYVEIDGSVPTRGPSDNWYRTHLPMVTPSFGAPSFNVAAYFVSEGLATAHLPVSTASLLPNSVRNQLRLYKIDNMSRRIVLVMRRHLLTHGTYAKIFREIVEYCQTDFTQQMSSLEFSSIVPPLGPSDEDPSKAK